MHTLKTHETSQKINNKFSLINKRKYLRNNSSRAEIYLWNFLKNSQLGRKFRRQHSVANFILDFYCPIEKLAIELDGDLHFEKTAEEYDIWRTKMLKEYNIRVIRFTNNDVYKNMNYVLEEIKRNFITRVITTPTSAQIAKVDVTPPQ